MEMSRRERREKEERERAEARAKARPTPSVSIATSAPPVAQVSASPAPKPIVSPVDATVSVSGLHVRSSRISVARMVDLLVFSLVLGAPLGVYYFYGIIPDLYWVAGFSLAIWLVYASRFRIWPGCWFGRKCLGIDVGNAQIKLAEVRDGSRPRLLRYAVIKTPDNSMHNGKVTDSVALHNGLTTILKDRKLRPSTLNAVTVLTGQNLLFRHIVLPKMPLKDIGKAIELQFEQYFEMKRGDTVADFAVIDTGNDLHGVSVMVAGMPKSPVLSLVDSLSKSGFKVESVDIEPLAVLRSCRASNHISETDTFAVLDFGAGTTNISVFKGTVLQSVRVLQVGGDDFTKTLMSHTQLSFEEAEGLKVAEGLTIGSETGQHLLESRNYLFNEISRTLSFYFTEHKSERLSRILVIGGASSLIGMKGQLRAYLLDSVMGESLAGGFVVEASDALAGLKHNLDAETARKVGPMLSVAIGLALGGVSGK